MSTTAATLIPGAYSLPPESLFELGDKLKAAHISAEPFPHTVINDFFPEHVLNQILSEFQKPDQLDWKRFDNTNEKKLALKTEMQLSNTVRHLLWELNSQAFILFLQKLTGIKGLVPDPHLAGGGLHQIERGGFLKIHADFNHHAALNLQRRINLLLYLNRDWKEEYGGHLELWSKDMKTCVKKVLPVFNRAVIFNTTDDAFHGHPEPLTCPEGWSRKSLAMYYYTNGRPEEEMSPVHSTLFQGRPGEVVEKGHKRSFKEVAKDFIPPIVVKAWRGISGKPPAPAV